MPGEVSRSFDPCPDDEPMEPRDAIVYDVDVAGGYDAATLRGEVIRLRNLLNDCWLSAGLLSSTVTGQPWQAWDDHSDLPGAIDDLAADADEYRADTAREEPADE
jgi:hypothetical protein